MNQIAEFTIVALMLAAVLTTVSIWAPRRVVIKVLALAVAAGFVPLAYASYEDLLSKPKPLDPATQNSFLHDAQVLSARMQPGDGIYLWLLPPTMASPRYYVVPWSDDVADQLTKAIQEAEKNNGQLKIRPNYERSWDKDPEMFYAPPQPKLPEKGGEERAPLEYRHPSWQA